MYISDCILSAVDDEVEDDLFDDKPKKRGRKKGSKNTKKYTKRIKEIGVKTVRNNKVSDFFSVYGFLGGGQMGNHNTAREAEK